MKDLRFRFASGPLLAALVGAGVGVAAPARAADISGAGIKQVKARSEVVEYRDTNTVFTSPTEKQTEDYITGRFG